MRINKLLLWLLVGIFSFGMVISCKKKQQVGSKNVFFVNIDTEPPNLDWHQASDTTSAKVISNIMDGLVDFDISDPNLKIIPQVAKSWDISKDSKVYTFYLRDDIYWTDGVKLTAKHFYDAWERLLNKATLSRYSYMLFDVLNAKEYNEGKIKDFSKVGVQVVNDYTFKVTLNKPAAYFIQIPPHESTYPIRKDIVEKFGNKWTEPENIVTNGPFKLTLWQHDYKIELTRNDAYYGPKAKLEKIEMNMVTEKSTFLNLYETGKIEMIETVPTTEIARLKGRPDFHQKTYLAEYYIGFNVKKEPFTNVKVRKAFNAAVDRTQVVQVLNGGQIPINNWIPSPLLGHNTKIGVTYDASKAKEWLKEGLTELYGKKAATAAKKEVKDLMLSDLIAVMPKVSGMFNTDDAHKTIFENLQSQWKKNLGIDVEILNQEWKVYLKTLDTDAPQVFRMGWVGDYPDPDNFMNLFTSYSENNRTNWKNKRYDELISLAAAELSEKKRIAYYDELQKILTEEDVPVIPLYHYSHQIMIKPYVKGYTINAVNKFYFHNVWKE